MAGYKFVGDASPTAPFLNGVPQRDLTLEDYKALEPSAQVAVRKSDLYVRDDDVPDSSVEEVEPPAADKPKSDKPAAPVAAKGEK